MPTFRAKGIFKFLKDIVKKNGIYEGGVIAPGLKLSILDLNKSTTSLPVFDLRPNLKVYGKNTKDALNAGFLWVYQGLINNIIKKNTKPINPNSAKTCTY